MDKKKKTFFERAEAFFAGKGFYIVLFLCVAVIGVSAWSLLTGGGTGKREADAGIAAANIDPGMTVSADAAPKPAATARPGPVPTSAPTEAPIASPKPAEKTEAPAAMPAPTIEARDYYIRPTAGPIENGYSMDALVFNRTMRDWRTHDGVDIAAELGAQVKALTDGKVTQVYNDDLFGTTVVISHRNGLESIYSNLAAAPPVAVGDQVAVGQVIGSVGDTALCESGEVCHLHFAMRRNGESVDPTEYLPQ